MQLRPDVVEEATENARAMPDQKNDEHTQTEGWCSTNTPRRDVERATSSHECELHGPSKHPREADGASDHAVRAPETACAAGAA